MKVADCKLVITFYFTMTGKYSHQAKSILNLKQRIGLQFMDILCINDRQKCTHLIKMIRACVLFCKSRLGKMVSVLTKKNPTPLLKTNF